MIKKSRIRKRVIFLWFGFFLLTAVSSAQTDFSLFKSSGQPFSLARSESQASAVFTSGYPLLLDSASLLSLPFQFQVIPESTITRPWVAGIETMYANAFIWGLNRYIRHADWSYISWDEIKQNIGAGFGWDPDHFFTNFFFHPYHGAIYYNIARTNGINPWVANLYSLGGSILWEFTAELDDPSKNDVIMTTLGGFFLGEVFYRFTSLVLDDSATGFKRVMKEIASALVNPARGFNRLFYGTVFSTKSYPNQIREPIHGSISFAGNMVLKTLHFADSNQSPVLSFDFIYGQTYKGNEARQPFDLFSFSSWVRFNHSIYLSVYGHGLLHGWNAKTPKGAEHLAGFFQEYDFIFNEAVKTGGVSFTGGVISDFPLSQKCNLVTSLRFGWLALGASSNDYIMQEERDYNYGTGYTAKLDGLLDLNKFGNFLVRYAHYSIYTIDGIDGVDRVNFLKLRYRIPVWWRISLGVEYDGHFRLSDYDDFPGFRKNLHEFRTSISYWF